MTIAVVGGGLQGVEAVYLLQEAGMDVRLLDRRADAPAAGLGPDFRQVEVTDPAALDRALAGVDMVFPALESLPALTGLREWGRARGLPVLYDPEAYAVSASKITSEAFFRRAAIPVPRTWPGCRFPVIAKPAGGSGSQGLRFFSSEADLTGALGDDPAGTGWVVQEFLAGPTYSVEVLRTPGRAAAIQVTDLYMDARYDCKRVTAPTVLAEDLRAGFEALSRKMAEDLSLAGIMDVEALLHDGGLRVLEIDARFPSQTPIAVYTSCGVNMAAALVQAAGGAAEPPALRRRHPDRGALLEHVQVAPGRLAVTGEHAVALSGPLTRIPGFFGADTALTDYAAGKTHWVATLIFSGADLREAWERREATIADLRRRFKLDRYLDPSPPAPPTEDWP